MTVSQLATQAIQNIKRMKSENNDKIATLKGLNDPESIKEVERLMKENEGLSKDLDNYVNELYFCY